MGISKISPLRASNRLDRACAMRALRELALGDGRCHSDAVPVVRPTNGRTRASAVNCEQSDPRTGAYSNHARTRNGSSRSSRSRTARSSASNVIAVAHGRFHPNGEARLTPQG